MKTVTLSMIVKNEEEMLGACLDSVAGFVDEIIVVDTGSTDRTVEIALEKGARVEHFEWCNDFSAARNYSKNLATCDYVLVLDADECMLHSEAAAFRDYVNSHDFDVSFITLYNARSRFDSPEAVVNGDAHVGAGTYLPRLMKNIPDTDYNGRIHESPTFFTGANILYSPFNIAHLGGDVLWRKQNKKAERNLQMLFATIEANENDANPRIWSYLVAELFNAQRMDEFSEAIETAWENLVNAVEKYAVFTSGIIPSIYPSYLIAQGKTTEALDALKFLVKHAKQVSTNPANFLFQLAYILASIDMPEELKEPVYQIIYEIAEELIAMDDAVFIDERIEGVTKHRPMHLKALMQIKRKEFDAAIETLHAGLETYGENQGTRTMLAECYLDQGNLQACFETLDSLISGDPQLGPDAWVLASTACLVIQKEDDSVLFMKEAMARSKMSFGFLHRLRLLNGLIARHSVLNGQPMAGQGAYGVIGAILAREPVISSSIVPSDLIEKVVVSLVQRQEFGLINRFFDARAEHILPGVRKTVTEALLAFNLEVQDDGELEPVFISGHPALALSKYVDGFEGVRLIEFSAQELEVIHQKWMEHDVQQSQEFLFSGGLDWLDDDSDEDSEESGDDNEIMSEALIELKIALDDFIRGQLLDNRRPVIVIDESKEINDSLRTIYPLAQYLTYIEHPRITAARIGGDAEIDSIANTWKTEVARFNQLARGNQQAFIVTSDLLINSQDSLFPQLSAFLGEPFSNEHSESWRAQEEVQAILTASIDEERDSQLAELLSNELEMLSFNG